MKCHRKNFVKDEKWEKFERKFYRDNKYGINWYKAYALIPWHYRAAWTKRNWSLIFN